MIVTPIERLRYHVTSRSDAPPYLVDIGSYRRNGVCLGRCECMSFVGTLLPLFKELIDPLPNDHFRCAHIKAARAYAFDELLDRFVTHTREAFNDYFSDEE